MAGTRAQAKWRDKNRFVKRQLNIMAMKLVHDDLEALAEEEGLRGKGEAVAFACYVVKALRQRAEFDPEANRLLESFRTGYDRDREFYGRAER